VQAEAYALLLARQRGARVPEVVVAGIAGPGTALLAVRVPTGTPLADLEPEQLTDQLLQETWQQARLLHEAHVVHGHLNLRHVVLTDDATVAVIERAGGASRTGTRRAADVAELLVSTSQVVGIERAVRAALTTLDTQELVHALPVLQPAALSRELRPTDPRDHRRFTQLLDELRKAVAEATHSEEPPLRELYRVSATNLMMAVGTLIGVGALLSQVAPPPFGTP